MASEGNKSYNFQDYQENQNLLHQKWLMGSAKCLFRLFYQTTSLRAFTTLTDLDYSMNSFQIKPLNSSLKGALAES